jgi:hypothetical protein
MKKKLFVSESSSARPSTPASNPKWGRSSDGEIVRGLLVQRRS